MLTYSVRRQADTQAPEVRHALLLTTDNFNVLLRVLFLSFFTEFKFCRQTGIERAT